METITFEIGDITIQLVNGEAWFWVDGTKNEPVITLRIDDLQQVLSTAHILGAGRRAPDRDAQRLNSQAGGFIARPVE